MSMQEHRSMRSLFGEKELAKRPTESYQRHNFFRHLSELFPCLVLILLCPSNIPATQQIKFPTPVDDLDLLLKRLITRKSQVMCREKRRAAVTFSRLVYLQRWWWRTRSWAASSSERSRLRTNTARSSRSRPSRTTRSRRSSNTHITSTSET